MNFRLVLSAAGSQAEAEKIVLHLLEHRLIACGNIIPGVTSLYWWQNKIERSTEFMLLLKTQSEKLEEVIEKLHEVHSYDVPEFVVLNPEEVSPEFLAWTNQVLGSSPRPTP